MKYRLIRNFILYYVYYYDNDFQEFMPDSWHLFRCLARRRIKQILKAKDWHDIGTLETNEND